MFYFNNKNIQRKILFVLAIYLSAQVSFAAAENPDAHAHQGDFNLKEMIFEHIGDAYDWHLFNVGEKHVSIPLPVIVRSDNTGSWHIFSSSRLAHGSHYEGFYISESEQYKGKVVESIDGTEKRPLDFSLTKNALAICFACIILLTVFLLIAKSYRKEPIRSRKGFVGSLEMLTLSIHDDIIKPCVGHDYARFAPYLLTVFYFIFLCNLMGLIPFFPFGANVTGNISVTFVLALFTFVITNIFGRKAYWKEIFWPDVPVLLKAPIPIMPLVEFLGIFTKPFALMIRLFANMMSGHMIILVFVGLIFLFKGMMGAGVAGGVSVIAVLFSIFMLTLDVLISFIQAYVFTILSAIFIGLSRAEHH
ncbi:MAG: F0F1 ATP synthase subunit A [Prevotellaceae bacterium]|jgi:F-type H+-transporting ATPase subunit a|nr:F0F1 ATP synthase subunit A [Prevotellaceae bacterium]